MGCIGRQHSSKVLAALVEACKQHLAWNADFLDVVLQERLAHWPVLTGSMDLKRPERTQTFFFIIRFFPLGGPQSLIEAPYL